MDRIYLSPPHMGSRERDFLLDAFDSNWIAPLGPHVDAFEDEFAAAIGVDHAVALSSGTAALHLALLILGVGPGDTVVVPTFTFVATANAVRYVGAQPVFLDSDRATWNLDPDLLAEEMDERARIGRLPKAVIAVDLYGQCADYGRIAEICRSYEVPLVEDAAESLGATWGDAAAGTLGDLGVFSFNGNKIITTSGGGMLVTSREDWARQARHLATQARDDAPHYEHSEVGYNYRMSNLLAALGRGQLLELPQRVAQRRLINGWYREVLAEVPGLDFMPEDPHGRPTWWLTCLTVDPERFGATREDIRRRLESRDIECRPTWKPMHLQPVYKGCAARGGAVAEDIFARGLCLPSGSALEPAQVEMIGELVLSTPGSLPLS
jgi:pyridoxal phosphate-dependent aminotransferase EpsN